MRTVRADWAVRGLRLTEAAAKIGSPAASLSAIMARKDRYLGTNIALRMADAFGYDATFLLSGQGELFPAAVPASGGAGETGEDWRRLVVASLESLRDALGALGARVSNLENIVGGGALNADYQLVSKFFAN